MSKTRLTKLEEQRAKLDAQIKAVKARDREQERKNDTRRKILIGALAKDYLETFPDSEFAGHLRNMLDQYTTRPQDRELLGLAPLPETASSADPRKPANESAPQASGPYNALARNPNASSS